MNRQAALELIGISIYLRSTCLIDGLSLRIEVGEVVTLMGPSGCGKSTLLAYLCGVLPAAFTATGRIRLAGRDISDLPPERRRLGILFQDDLLFPHLSVGQNLGFALAPQIRDRRERRRRIEQALAEAGLAGFAERDPETLSGGQRARVAVMRTLLSQPQGLLLDEPFARLDAGLRQQFRRFVFEHARECRLPTLLVTHDRADAEAAGGRILTLADALAATLGDDPKQRL